MDAGKTERPATKVLFTIRANPNASGLVSYISMGRRGLDQGRGPFPHDDQNAIYLTPQDSRSLWVFYLRHRHEIVETGTQSRPVVSRVSIRSRRRVLLVGSGLPSPRTYPKSSHDLRCRPPSPSSGMVSGDVLRPRRDEDPQYLVFAHPGMAFYPSQSNLRTNDQSIRHAHDLHGRGSIHCGG